MTANPVDLVIFDCDGTLIDSERIYTEVDALVLADLGCVLTEAEIVERLVGSSAEVFRAVVEERLGRPLAEDWELPYTHLYREALATRLKPVDGIPALLESLTVPVCVASNGSHASIARNLATTALARHFDGRVFSAADVARGKPAPDLFLHAARTMGADPARCVVIEDSAYGVEAARAAGMRSFGYAGGLTPAARLEGTDTVVFHDMRELAALLALSTPEASRPGLSPAGTPGDPC
ncbi:HAD family phosphatase [uncultured Streptomyces sp.]|uniref:HAD family hydrolase n=1 Tax=uncultured Streptomyces sp. TaxID=174707 RepID=UPI002602D609|nr:HAD family phosphatase [uncultured Streptomyces sp.]